MKNMIWSVGGMNGTRFMFGPKMFCKVLPVLSAAALWIAPVQGGVSLIRTPLSAPAPMDFLWTPSPFTWGFAVLEPPSLLVYSNSFPRMRVRGSVCIPVFMVDWSDFDPVTDLSNYDNPASDFPGYVQSSPDSLALYLNADTGAAGYFREVSGGQLNISFEVFPWIVSDSSEYLRDKEPYYLFYDSGSTQWQTRRADFACDALRAAISELGADLTRFDADSNGILDGFVIVYEGGPGKLAGTNLSMAGGVISPEGYPALLNAAALVDSADTNFNKFQSQQVLFGRYLNIPEQMNPSGSFSSLFTWAHELGHLLLGYSDYYGGPNDPGDYALSAHGGYPVPFHPSGLEKWMFGHWIEPDTLELSGTHILMNHHLAAGQEYADTVSYLAYIPLSGEGEHFLLIENRYFLPFDSGGSFFNEQKPGESLESGLVIFEVNQGAVSLRDQIIRHLPERLDSISNTSEIGAFIPGDEFYYEDTDFALTIHDITGPGDTVSFTLTGDFPVPAYWAVQGKTDNIRISAAGRFLSGNIDIILYVPADMDAEVFISDMRGRKVTALHEGMVKSGRHILTWNGQGALDGKHHSGIHAASVRTVHGTVSSLISPGF